MNFGKQPVQHRGGLTSALFPGIRAVWLGAAVVFVISGAILARSLVERTVSLTGTNSVGVATVVFTAPAGSKACVRDLDVPSGTGRIEVAVGRTKGRAQQLDAELSLDGAVARLKSDRAIGALRFVSFDLPRRLARDASNATLCMSDSRMTLDYGGAAVQRTRDAPVSSVAGRSLTTEDISVRYARPTGRNKRLVEVLPEALRRSTTFESSPGRVLTWLALPALLLLTYLTVRVAATVGSRPVRELALLAATVAFVHAATWSVLLHPFHGADESEHFAYAQHLAASNQRADAGVSQRPPYSSAQLRLMEALHHSSTILNPTSRPRWLPVYAAQYEHSSKEVANDGGGFTTGASGHSPFYYFLIGLPLRIQHNSSQLPGLLLAMRLFNALFASGIAALAVLSAGLVLGGNKNAAWLAGVVVSMQPVFGSVAGAVNNDTAVNLASAALLYTLIRAVKVRASSKNAVVAGALLVTLPVAKITGFAIVPVALVAAAVIAITQSRLDALRWTAIVAVIASSVALLWVFALAPTVGGDRGTLVNQHPAAPSLVGAPNQQLTISLKTRVDYFVQTFVPQAVLQKDHWTLPGTGLLERWPAYAIYVNRGYGLLGWKSVELSGGLLHMIFGWLAVGFTGATVAFVQRRRSWRHWLPELLMLLAAVMTVLGFVSYAFSTNSVVTDFGEQGRYVFTALVPLAVLFSASILAAKGTARESLVGVMVSISTWVGVFVYATALRGWFT